MEIKIDRDIFLSGVHKVQGIVESKGAMPILSHCLITTEKDGIYLQATDLEIGVKGFYPAKIVKQGAMTLNARKLFGDSDLSGRAPFRESGTAPHCQP